MIRTSLGPAPLALPRAEEVILFYGRASDLLLRVTIVEARELPTARRRSGSSTCDPYCVCDILDESGNQVPYAKTEVCKDTVDPLWNHVFEIPHFKQGHGLKFTVYSCNTSQDDIAIGMLTLPYSQFGMGGLDKELPLQLTKRRRRSKPLLPEASNPQEETETPSCLRLRIDLPGSLVKITKNWLAAHGQAAEASNDEKEQQASMEAYRAHLKQAMLIAALRCQLLDLSDAGKRDPETDLPLSPELVAEEEKFIREQITAMQQGMSPVPIHLTAHMSMTRVGDQQDLEAKRHLLMKRGDKGGLLKKRYFVIDDGYLKVYKRENSKQAKPTLYNLREADGRYESNHRDRKEPGVSEEWPPEYKERVAVSLAERPQGPVFLYTKDRREAMRWERAVRMSHFLNDPRNAEALRYVIGRAAGSTMAKGWTALVAYAKEMQETRTLMRAFFMRIARFDLSKAWSKLRTIYMQKKMARTKRRGMHRWAATMMKEKLDESRENQSEAKPVHVMRHMLISWAQQSFRRYRQEKIISRSYPLGSPATTRMQQAMNGFSMACAFRSLKGGDALQLVLGNEVSAELDANQIVGHKYSYSEVGFTLKECLVKVDEGFTMLSFTESGPASHVQISQSGSWAAFVSLDQISSVVLHSERVLANEGKQPKLHLHTCEGAWFTINGPRVCWCRQIRTLTEPGGKAEKNVIVGDPNGLAVMQALSTGAKVRVLKVAISVHGALRASRPMFSTEPPEHQFEGPSFEPESDAGSDRLGLDGELPAERPLQRRGAERRTHLVLHFLGRQFKSSEVPGQAPSYPGHFEAEVPISFDDESLAALDTSEVSVEVVEGGSERESPQTLWAGQAELRELLLPEDCLAEQSELAAKRGARIGAGSSRPSELQEASLARTLRDGRRSAVRTVSLVSPWADGGRVEAATASLDLRVDARVQESPGQRCISPELQGRGPVTCLFSSNRAAWLDPKLGQGRVHVDRAPSFLELSIMHLRFPDNDKADKNKLFRYYIEVKCGGVSASTTGLCRVREVWQRVMPVDPTVIEFGGSKLVLPLPPGFWASVEQQVEVLVLRSVQQDSVAMTFEQMLESSSNCSAVVPFQRVYHGVLSLRNMALDETLRGVAVAVSRITEAPARTHLASGEGAQPASKATVLLHATLRDRDTVRLSVAAHGRALGMGQGVALCVGDRALLRLEELLCQPRSEKEFRSRLFPEEACEGPQLAPGAKWQAPLREPCLSHEYLDSGLGKLYPQPKFRQAIVPKFVEDAIPHRFVMPPLEIDFLRESRPGVYWRILDDLTRERVRSSTSRPEGVYAPVAITHLSHSVKHVPCVVLAVYVNRTCDLEVGASFISEWANWPLRRYAIPGSVAIEDYEDTSPAAIQNTQAGSGDVSQAVIYRVMLKGVPISCVVPTQMTGFNVYDAAFSSVDDVIKANPCRFRSEFNPMSHMGSADVGRGCRGACAVHAGPLPADAGPACQYEWSLRLHAKSEEEMCQFVKALRQSVHVNHFNQQSKLDDFRSSPATATVPVGPVLGMDVGHLEVVLVEARHLRPQDFRRDLRSRVAKLLLSDIVSFATFKLLNGGPSQELVYKGSKTQICSSLRGDDPKWSELPELRSSGGWVFKSPPMCPKDMPNLFLQLDVLKDGMHPTPIGCVRMPVTKPPNVDRPLRIIIESASGLRDADWLPGSGASDPYCTCEIVGKPFSQFRTQTRANTLDPVWNHEAELNSYYPGDSLLFCVYDEDQGKSDDFLGKFTLRGDLFYPQGIQDSLPLEGEGGPEEACLQIRILPFAPAKRVPRNSDDTGFLCNPERPFNNLWLPLSVGDAHVGGGLKEKRSGEVHIMTLWVPEQPQLYHMVKNLPKTARGWMMHDLRLKFQQSIPREPIYGVQVRKHGYNPNLARDALPKTLSEAVAHHVETMYDSAPYTACLERQAIIRWRDWWQSENLEDLVNPHRQILAAEGDDTPRLGSLWLEPQAGEAARRGLHGELHDLILRGVPPTLRQSIWLELTHAAVVSENLLREVYQRGGGDEDPPELPEQGDEEYTRCLHEQALEHYEKLVEEGRLRRCMATQQLQEDMLSACAWERSENAAAVDLHQLRLQQAQDVCLALIAFSRDSSPPQFLNYKDNGENSCSIAYCESILVLAFFMLLAMAPTQLGDDGGNSTPFVSDPAGFVPKSQSYGMEPPNREDEVRSFWLICTLVTAPCNQAFREYYGTPKASTYDVDAGHIPLCDQHGAMEDVSLLSFWLSRHEREVWIHISALGFHLSMVFYAAFMRLFTFLLPTASLFRLWDLLFTESARPDRPSHMPARHSLIDLAFGAIRRCRTELMQCESAAQVRDCLVAFLEDMYDPAAMLDLLSESEQTLWTVMASSLQAFEYERSNMLWERYFMQYRWQNSGLQEITRATNLELAESRVANADFDPFEVPPDADPADTGTESRATTRNVAISIMPSLKSILCTPGECEQYGGMFRQTPPKLHELGPAVDEGIVSAVWNLGMLVYEQLPMCYDDPPGRPLIIGMPIPPGSQGEPSYLDQGLFHAALQRAVGRAWNSSMYAVYKSFESPLEKRMSLNEFLVALICCSKGTVSEKAMALFHVYGYNESAHEVPHIVPTTHSTATVLEKVADFGVVAMYQLSEPPQDKDVHKMALHFRILTSAGKLEDLIGEVYIPSLGPFTEAGDEPQGFPIWGSDRKLPPGAVSRLARGGELVRPSIGVMNLAIMWHPEEDDHSVGQLSLHLYDVTFFGMVETPHLKNPRVTVVMYGEDGEEQPIRRCEAPRTVRQRAVDLAHSLPANEYIEFARTMWPDPRGKLNHYMGVPEHGWDRDNALWQWGGRFAEQNSEPGIRFRAELTEVILEPNTISMQACRIITQGILARSLMQVTNRQAALIADLVFSRAGVVPGILDAVLVKGKEIGSEYESIAQLKADSTSSRPAYVDVKHQLLLVHEAQVSSSAGGLNLFPSHSSPFEPSASGISIIPWKGTSYDDLEGMRIQDPFPGFHKVLWVRFIRAGDGQRSNARIKVDEHGRFQASEIHMDMDTASTSGKVQMTLAKEEFVNCLLSNPLLSEPLRRLSTVDNTGNLVAETAPVSIEVIIPDPDEEVANMDMLDVMNARQGVLLEIYDSDIGRDDFLGECWLPSLGTLSPEPKKLVLPVSEAQSVEDNMTRPDPVKFQRDRLGVPGKECTGILFLTASWTFPAEAPDEELQESREGRVKREEMLHTGRLQLKIEKAEGLRAADKQHGSRSGTSDPYVSVYIRNETFTGKQQGPGFGPGGWRISQLTGRHEEVARSSVRKKTLDPVWDEEFDILLQTGSFERKTKQTWHMNMPGTPKASRRRRDQHDLAVLGHARETRLKIFFGCNNEDVETIRGEEVAHGEQGYRHSVQVYLSDSMYQFKLKLAMACKMEAEEEQDDHRREQYETFAEGIFRQDVMVFVAPDEFLELDGVVSPQEFEQRRQLEEQDPSNWQPLDPIRTFDDYAGDFGFGGAPAPQLRMSPGLADYASKNNRYREFEQQQKEWNSRLEELNTDTQCFGYAKYPHPEDAGSIEWRQAIVELLQADDDSASDRFRAKFIHTPLAILDDDAAEEGEYIEADEDSVRLAPAQAKILGIAGSVVAKVKQLCDDEGLREDEIAARINKELREVWELQRQSMTEGVDEGTGPPRPRRLSALDVQRIMKASG